MKRGGRTRVAGLGGAVRAWGLLAVLLAAPMLLGAAPGVAWGHGETSPLIQTVVDGVTPAASGLSVRNSREYPTLITAYNRTKTDLVILADPLLRDGSEPFLRIGPTGAYANVSSPTWYASGNAGSVVNPPPSVRLGGPPHWVQVSRTPAWAWFDRRMEPYKTRVPQQQLRGDRTVRLDSWTIPTRYGSQAGGIHGHVEYQPPVGSVLPSFDSPVNVAPGVQAGLLGGPNPGLFIASTGAQPVTVLGQKGEPFARIDARGVQVNVRSTTYADTVVAGGGRPPGTTDPSAPPRWRRVADVPQYGWVDYRLRYTRTVPPPDVVRSHKRTVLMRWTVPILIGSRRVELRGTQTWVPTALPGQPGRPSDPLSGWLLGGLPAIGLVALLGLAVRRRQAAHAPVAGRPARAA